MHVMITDMAWLEEAQSVCIHCNVLALSGCLVLLVSKPSWHEVRVTQAPCGEAISCS